jgi:hypothetical protein
MAVLWIGNLEVHLGRLASFSAKPDAPADLDDDTELDRSLRFEVVASGSDGAAIPWDKGKAGKRCLHVVGLLSANLLSTVDQYSHSRVYVIRSLNVARFQ